MSRLNQVAFLIVWLILGLWPLYGGLSYYVAPIQERAFMSLHDAFKPSGLIGQGLGIFGSLMIIVGVASYSARKRWTFMERMGRLRTWLTVHIFLCTLGPFYILLHTTLKIGNVASISFWSMAIVVASGVFGRFIYVRIPKTSEGVFFSESDIERRQEALVTEVNEVTVLDRSDVSSFVKRFHETGSTGFFRAVRSAFQIYGRRSALGNEMEEYLKERGIPTQQRGLAVPLLMENIRLDKQRQLSQPFQRLFGYWHVMHIPLAFVMLITFIVHVGAAIAFGYTWIF